MDLSWFMISLSDIGLAGFCHASKSCDEGMLTSGTRAYVWEEETWYKVFQSCYLLFQMCYHSLFLKLRYLEILWYVAIVLVIISITIFSQISVNTWHFNVHYTLLLFIIPMYGRPNHKAHVTPGVRENNCSTSSSEMKLWSPVAKGNMDFPARQYFNVQLGFIIVKLLVALIGLYHGALIKEVLLVLSLLIHSTSVR